MPRSKPHRNWVPVSGGPFWDQVEIAAGELRKDAAEWEDELAERRAWDATLADDLEAD